jgi:HEAT repeat protein
MGGKEERQTMKSLICALTAVFLLLNPAHGSGNYDYSEYLPKLLRMLQKGSPQEQKYALASLWFLAEDEYRNGPNVFDPIITALNNKNPSVREAAAAFFSNLGKSAKGRIKEEPIIAALTVALTDDNPGVRAEAATALLYYKDKRTIEPLAKCLKDNELQVRINAAFTLGELKALDAVPALLAAVKENTDWRNKIAQQECLMALRKLNLGNDDAVQILIEKFHDEYLKDEIIKTLGLFRIEKAKDLLVKATEDPDEKTRKLALQALERLVRTETKPTIVEPPPQTTDATQGSGYAEFETGTGQSEKNERFMVAYEGRLNILLKSAKDPSSEVRATTVNALGNIKDPKAIAALIEALNDGNQDVRIKAVEALGQQKDAIAVQPLIEKLDDSDLKFREKVIQALNEFTDEKIIYALLPFAGFNYARTTILALAEKNAQGFVYVTKKDGVRTVDSNTPETGKHLRLMVYPRMVDKVLVCLDTQDIENKIALLGILYHFSDERIEPVLLKQFNDPDARMREAACRCVGPLGPDAAVTKLIGVLKDPNAKVRIAAALSLSELDDPRAINPLIEALSEVTPKKQVTLRDDDRWRRDWGGQMRKFLAL